MPNQDTSNRRDFLKLAAQASLALGLLKTKAVAVEPKANTFAVSDLSKSLLASIENPISAYLSEIKDLKAKMLASTNVSDVDKRNYSEVIDAEVLHFSGGNTLPIVGRGVDLTSQIPQKLFPATTIKPGLSANIALLQSNKVAFEMLKNTQLKLHSSVNQALADFIDSTKKQDWPVPLAQEFYKVLRGRVDGVSGNTVHPGVLAFSGIVKLGNVSGFQGELYLLKFDGSKSTEQYAEMFASFTDINGTNSKSGGIRVTVAAPTSVKHLSGVLNSFSKVKPKEVVPLVGKYSIDAQYNSDAKQVVLRTKGENFEPLGNISGLPSHFGSGTPTSGSDNALVLHVDVGGISYTARPKTPFEDNTGVIVQVSRVSDSLVSSVK